MAVDGQRLLFLLRKNARCRPYVLDSYFIDTVRDSISLIDHNAAYNLIIVNTEELLNKDDDDLLMHWLGIAITHTGETIFLDSFAIQPNKYSDTLEGFLRNIGSEVLQCPFRIQSDDSQVSCRHVVFFEIISTVYTFALVMWSLSSASIRSCLQLKELRSVCFAIPSDI